MELLESLVSIYAEALVCCEPGRILRERMEAGLLSIPSGQPVALVALGKAGAALYSAAASLLPVECGFVAIPHGYATEVSASVQPEIAIGSHPEMDRRSFHAGERLMRFVRNSPFHPLFLVSGGSSASVEVPLRPWFDEPMLMEINALLVRSGMPIREMNVIRKHLSAIKGGRLSLVCRVPSTTLVYSDVSDGDEASVGSGPTLPDPSSKREAIALLDSMASPICREAARLLDRADLPDTPKELPSHRWQPIAGNGTLIHAAAQVARRRDLSVRTVERQLEGDVDRAAEALLSELTESDENLVVAGGEPTVKVEGDGRGGRCSELALRMLIKIQERGLHGIGGIFASSDGIDGNSGAAGVAVDFDAAAASVSRHQALAAVRESDSFSLFEGVGVVIEGRPTGNNLRDLYLLARK